MPIGVIGRKCGMTRVFTEDGATVPVTVIEALPNRVTQVKNVERDGYRALQVTSGSRKASRLSKPETGHFAKAGAEPGYGPWELRLPEGEGADLEVGAEITVAQFQAGQMVDVTGVTRGKGYAGTIKRYHFSSQDETHGNSVSTRAPGSIGQRQTPGACSRASACRGTSATSAGRR
jgi:large subunit ribosomal protein L3